MVGRLQLCPGMVDDNPDNGDENGHGKGHGAVYRDFAEKFGFGELETLRRSLALES